MMTCGWFPLCPIGLLSASTLRDEVRRGNGAKVLYLIQTRVLKHTHFLWLSSGYLCHQQTLGTSVPFTKPKRICIIAGMGKQHQQAILKLRNGMQVEVDNGIRELVFVMNVPGLQTFNSCEGTVSDQGYIQFGGSSAKPFMLRVLQEMLSDKRKLLGGIKFESTATRAWPNSFVVRWNPYDFRRVLRYTKKAVQSIQSGERI
jgi:hypothetical protein